MTQTFRERIRTRRANIDRYRRLLATPLTKIERDDVERRIAEERAALAALITTGTPLPGVHPIRAARPSVAS